MATRNIDLSNCSIAVTGAIQPSPIAFAAPSKASKRRQRKYKQRTHIETRGSETPPHAHTGSLLALEATPRVLEQCSDRSNLTTDLRRSFQTQTMDAPGDEHDARAGSISDIIPNPPSKCDAQESKHENSQTKGSDTATPALPVDDSAQLAMVSPPHYYKELSGPGKRRDRRARRERAYVSATQESHQAEGVEVTAAKPKNKKWHLDVSDPGCEVTLLFYNCGHFTLSCRQCAYDQSNSNWRCVVRRTGKLGSWQPDFHLLFEELGCYQCRSPDETDLSRRVEYSNDEQPIRDWFETMTDVTAGSTSIFDLLFLNCERYKATWRAGERCDRRTWERRSAFLSSSRFFEDELRIP